MALSNPRRTVAVTRLSAEQGNALSVITNMRLRKGATFHSPSSPTLGSCSTFAPPSLSRSQTHLDDVVDANRRRIALTLSEVEEALANTENLPLSPRFTKKKTLRDNSLPVPRGFLVMPIVDPALAKQEERRVLRPRPVNRSRHHASDSGIGSSLSSVNDKCAPAAGSAVDKRTKTQTASAITRSAAASSATQNLPALGRKAINRIHEHTLRPLLEKPSLKDFESIVLDVPRKIRSKEIICIRDLEKTLIFMAPVSQLLNDSGLWGETYRMLCQKEKAKTAALYLDFCLTSIRCIQATVEYLSDREQVRPGDRPYTNGYFIDLKEQIYQYGQQLAAAKETNPSGDLMDIDQYVYPRFVPLDHSTDHNLRADEIRLYGGIAENGRPAELVRVKKDGTAISMATGKVIDLGAGPIALKRSLSQQREDDEEIMRSMARRKKNATAEELAPKRCREHGCTKEFKRPCDLTKHEKTHSRPWKCPVPTCKYHEFGWPTEKEMDRHVNDKHSDAPAMYQCDFKPCPYKSKRESNCKQHMEKAHGWSYVRSKTNGKKLPDTPEKSEQQTPPLGNVSTPSTDVSYGVPTPPHDSNVGVGTDFPMYQNNQDWLSSYGVRPEQLEGMDLILDNPTATSSTSYEQYPPYQNGSTFILDDEDIYAAHMQLPHLPTHDQLFGNAKMLPQQMQAFAAPRPISTAVPTQGTLLPGQQQQQQRVPAHFSPVGQENAMLYTPTSLDEVDEGFDDSFGADAGDFQLFPANAVKGSEFQPLFGEVPSANLGFSQNSQQDFFQQIDWSSYDFHGFPE